MSEKKIELSTNVNSVYEVIKKILSEARANVYRSVNFAMVRAYWNIGKVIVEEEQKGKERADYGKYLITQLSKKLTRDFGKGFTETNIRYMRQFYNVFPKHHALRDEFAMWSIKIGLPPRFPIFTSSYLPSFPSSLFVSLHASL